MHQKSTMAPPAQSASTENEEGRDEAVRDRETERVLRNPFDDDGEDEVDDDSDDGLGDDAGVSNHWDAMNSRGGWWRGALQRSRERFGDGRDDSDSDKEDRAEADDDDDDDEFGDFAMPETDNRDDGSSRASVIVKPLPVHPPPHNPKSSAFTSLWPFSSKEREKEKQQMGEESTAAATATAEPASEAEAQDHDTTIKMTHEAARRTSIEDPDEEVVL
ncbi:hypothetical protein GGR51DRAFT_403003 [Nemania sp. FL0031]|nr:hypothetical protein GGR51DRAFT_403003 [Nemania sp. FL0031]